MWKDNETIYDLLDYQYMVNVITDIVYDDNLLPASIGIYGDWGSGKSSLMHMCINELQVKQDHGKTKSLIFNGWLFESYSDAKTALLNSILDEISKEQKIGDKAKSIIQTLYKSVDKFALAEKALKYGVGFFATGGVDLLASLTTDTLLSAAKKEGVFLSEKEGSNSFVSDVADRIKAELNHEELRDNIRQFQKQFEELLKESKIDRLVIFIDELDRCREDTILDTLEAMKLFMFVGKVAFVIGADERHISYAVKSKFKDIEGIQIDIGKEYLEKLVQYPIKIPRMDIDETGVYIASLLIQADFRIEVYEKFRHALETVRKEDFLKPPLNNITIDLNEKDKVVFDEDIAIAEQLAEVLSDGLHGNPRQVKRFLNMMDMRMKMAMNKAVTLDRKVLTKIMILEYVQPTAFNLIAKMAANNLLSEELALIEKSDKKSSDIDGVKQLKTWIKDDWFRNWVDMSPILSQHELNQYFYFTRTSLDEKISRISANLSPKAQEVLEMLLSKTDLKLNKALEIEVSDIEAVNILEAMAVKMKADAKISEEHLNAFISFTLCNKNRYGTALSLIKEFPASKLSLSHMVHMANFAKESGYIPELQNEAKEWGKSSRNLETTFNNNLNA